MKRKVIIDFVIISTVFINIIQYQMMKPSNKIIDSVSASELLKALNTLHHMGESQDPEISFSHDTKAAPQNNRLINFDQYMAKKGEEKTKNTNKAHRKSISPIRQQQPAQPIHVTDLKSRSHSPIAKKPEKTERSMIAHNNQLPRRSNKENKQNKPILAVNSKADQVYRASFQSKRILDEREKKGAAYVPIQLRTEELLKEKQAKLARLQRQQEMNNILREKECTFKPNIKHYKRKTNLKDNKDTTSNKENQQEAAKGERQQPLGRLQEEQLGKIQEESVRFDDCSEENEFLCTPTQPGLSDDPQNEPSEYLFPVHCQAKPVRKYKNEKFNMLLDLIH